MQTLTFNIFGMHCTSCAMSIDGELEDTEGIKEARTNYFTQQAKVTFDPKKINPNRIISIIRKLDDTYDAEIAEKTNNDN